MDHSFIIDIFVGKRTMEYSVTMYLYEMIATDLRLLILHDLDVSHGYVAQSHESRLDSAGCEAAYQFTVNLKDKILVFSNILKCFELSV